MYIELIKIQLTERKKSKRDKENQNQIFLNSDNAS